MPVLKSETASIRSQEDIVRVRQKCRAWAVELGLNLVDQTKLVTAASELARNTLIHGGGGAVLLERIQEGVRHGLRLTFSDRGSGIRDIERAMQDGYTTSSGLGLGLGGAKRLVNEFAIQSEPGKGTEVSIVRWKN